MICPIITFLPQDSEIITQVNKLHTKNIENNIRHRFFQWQAAGSEMRALRDPAAFTDDRRKRFCYLKRAY